MADFTSKPTFVGRLVTLRPVDVTDVPILGELMADPAVGKPLVSKLRA